MDYKKIQATIIDIEASDKQYFEYASPTALMLAHGYTKPDAVAMMVFDAAWREGGSVLPAILRRLELKELGVNCHGSDYWLDKLETKYTPKESDLAKLDA